MIHGPSKRYVDNYLYHSPKVGIIASYTPTEFDVQDHFDIFRGVDQIESFAQAVIVSCSAYLESTKYNLSLAEIKTRYTPLFISIGHVDFRNYLQKGETFIIVGLIRSYKFRQMVADGRIYKFAAGFDPEKYFADFSDDRLLKYDFDKNFNLVAELFEITGRGLKK